MTSPSPPRLNTDFSSGTIIARNYRIEEQLGGGGMGTVYRCTDLAVSRTVAVKFLHPHLVNTSKWLLRFQQEARAIGRLSHPNIIAVYSFSMDQDTPYIVMDYVKGASLDQLLAREGSLSVERTLKIMSQVADGLAHAHEQGIVHRDLKPSNIVILDDSDDVVRILDFGIAKMSGLDTDMDTAPKLTQTGEVFGSPAYMSPEQAMGKRIDGRSDEYSFGCVLYECLTGAVPFVGNSLVEVMMKHTGEVPLSLNEASLGKKFPAHVQVAVMKMLAKNPADRFDSMADAKRAMYGFSDVLPNQKSNAVKRKKEAKFHPLLIASAVAAVILVCAPLYFVIRDAMATFLGVGQPSNTTTATTTTTSVTTQTAPPDAPEINTNYTLHQRDREVKARRALVDWISRNPDTIIIQPSAQIGDNNARELTNDAVDEFTILKKLKVIDLTNCAGIRDVGVAKLVKLPHIFQVSLNNCCISDDATKLLAKMDKKDFICVELGLTTITDGALEPLMALKKLHILNLYGCKQLTGNALSTVGQFKELTDLNISKTSTGSGIHFLKDLKLVKLYADGADERDVDVECLPKMQTLQGLSLAETKLTDKSLASIGHLKNLRYLSFNKCRDLGSLIGISALVGASKLETLMLNETKVGDRECEELAKIKTLKKLSLGGTHISARGLQALAKLDNLNKLILPPTLDRSAAVEQFRASHPHCVVEIKAAQPELMNDAHDLYE